MQNLLTRAVEAIFKLLIHTVCVGTLFAEELQGSDAISYRTEREIYTCENEEKRFSSWSKLAGKSTENDFSDSPVNLEIVSVKVGDGREIRGIKIPTRVRENPRFALLVIPGNGWKAQDLLEVVVPHFPEIAGDILIFDFRGYGISKPGYPSMSAIVSDYRDLVDWIRDSGYGDIYLYAFSFGGVVALNAFPDLKPFRRAVLDAVPAHPSKMGFYCDVEYDPVEIIGDKCKDLTIMHGKSDWVIRRKSIQELIDAVLACGGKADIDRRAGHPFQIEWRKSRARRVQIVMNHLDIEGNSNAAK